jgi:hypothetical protein
MSPAPDGRQASRASVQESARRPGGQRRKTEKAGEIIPAGTPEEISPKPVATPFIPCDGTHTARKRSLSSSSPAMLFIDGSSMTPIIPQTDTMETWQNLEMRMAASGAYPNFRILLAVRLQKSSVIVYICLFSHGGDKAGGRKKFFTSDLCLTGGFKPLLSPD